jgi:hypothetical protein
MARMRGGLETRPSGFGRKQRTGAAGGGGPRGGLPPTAAGEL